MNYCSDMVWVRPCVYTRSVEFLLHKTMARSRSIFTNEGAEGVLVSMSSLTSKGDKSILLAGHSGIYVLATELHPTSESPSRSAKQLISKPVLNTYFGHGTEISTCQV